MQVILTGEEYEKLTLKNEAVINELKEKHSREMMNTQTYLMGEIRLLQSQLKEKESSSLTLDELNWILSWASVSFNEFGFDKEEHSLHEKLCDLKESMKNKEENT